MATNHSKKLPSFYEPTAEHISRLDNESWCASFSGGKDSTALVTWVEWLRRAGWITVAQPKLVRSDTGVEETNLMAVSWELTDLLRSFGWDCGVVRPEVHERLYTQILGRGLPPIHPGIRRMRWCTRSTKIDPMARWKGGVTEDGAAPLSVTGLRLGESAMRDGKLKKSFCAAGGECGIPDPGEGRYSPLLNWKLCHVVDWLSGNVGKAVRDAMEDVFEVTRKLVAIYGIATATNLFEEEEIISTARFGCIGCPAIGAEANAPLSVKRRNGFQSPLNELYDVWFEARQPQNRLVWNEGGKSGMGALKMETRKRLFSRVMDIQQRAGVVLITPEDEAYIRQCWADKTYPRYWSAADEEVTPSLGPLFD